MKTIVTGGGALTSWSTFPPGKGQAGQADADLERLTETVNRLVSIAKDLGTRVGRLDRANALRCGLPGSAEGPDAPAPIAALIEAARALVSEQRSQPLFGAAEIFDNRHWLLVLEMFIADGCQSEVSVKEACLALGGAQSTALRKLLTMERLGVLVSREDPNDGRRRLVSLSEGAGQAVRDYLSGLTRQMHRPSRLRLRLTANQVQDSDVIASKEVQPEPDRSTSGSISVLQQ